MAASDLATDPINSRLLSCKIGNLFNKIEVKSSQYNEFQEFVFEDGKSIASAINSGEKTYNDLLNLLREARKFKEWLAGKPNDGKLLKEYFKEVTKDSWVDKLPNKTIRWSLFSGVGLAIDAAGAGGLGTLAGLAISAGDNFFLDTVIKGWKPDHFVNGELKKFLGGS